MSTTLEGVVDRIFFRSESSGFSAMALTLDDGDKERVCGQTPLLRKGDRVRVSGAFEQDKKWGRQFRFHAMTVDTPSTDEGLVSTLTGLVPGLGPATAAKLVARLGGASEAILAMDSDPDQVRTVLGSISKGRHEMLCDSLLEQWQIRRVELALDAQLASVKLPFGVRSRIAARYQGRSMEIVRNNPYLLAEEVPGIGFSTADEIARSVGYVGQDDPVRAKAVIRRVLQDAASMDGHTVISRSSLLARFVSLAPSGWTDPNKSIDDALKDRQLDEDLVAPFVTLHPMLHTPDGQTDLVALRSLFEDERIISDRVHDRIAIKEGKAYQDRMATSAAAVAEVVTKLDMKLSDSQQMALFRLVDEPIAVLTGGPGTGKTTIVRALCVVYEMMGVKIAMCAPTGRAARRMAEATGRVATTIHKLLEWGPSASEEEEIGFRRNENNPLEAGIVICDESSMLDVTLMASLLRALPANGRILLVGDVDQLPPVGPGAPLRDIITSNRVTVACLTEVHRQAEGSGIVMASCAIRDGKPIAPNARGDRSSGAIFVIEKSSPGEIQEEIVSVVSRQIPKAFGVSASNDVQVIVPMRKHDTGTDVLNQLLQERLNPPSGHKPEVVRSDRVFRAGDRVMQTVNNYTLRVMNGQIGIIEDAKTTSLSDPSKAVALRVVFEDRGAVEYQEADVSQLRHAYACTVHKMQGSQAKVVVVGLSRSHWFMLNRTILYTAITRAEMACIIVCDKGSLSKAIRNKGSFHRTTSLPNMLEL